VINIRKKIKQSFTDFNPNRLINYYNFIGGMNLKSYSSEKSSVTIPLRGSIMRFLLCLFLLVCLSGTALAANIPAGHVSGYNLNSAGTTYVLTGNILANTNAFSITANNVVLDGKGYSIDCGLTGTGVGITCSNHRNVTIKNVRVIQHNSSTSSDGIRVQNSANILISNCSASSIAGSGMYITGSAATIDRCKTSSNKGIPLYIVAGNSQITSCSAVSSSNTAIYIANSKNNIVSNCIGHSNTGSGIEFRSSNNNKVSNCAGYSNTSHGLAFTSCIKNNVRASSGYSKANDRGSGIFLTGSSNNIFTNCTGSSYLYAGIYLYGASTYNTFINCLGESYGRQSLDQGIWFKFPSAASSGTNVYTNCISRSPLATTSNDPKKITFLNIGDSITAGSATGLPHGAYVYYVNLTLSKSGYVFYNVGLGGETSESGRLRFLDEMALFKPKYVTILYGANDLRYSRPQQSTINDILWMASQAKAHGATPIILLTPAKGSLKEIIYLDQNLSKQALAAGYKVFNVYDLIDTVPNNSKYDGFNSTNYLPKDGTHPNQTANKLIGDAFAKYIVTLTSKKG
jgi:parallel beta-helix repeat protein